MSKRILFWSERFWPTIGGVGLAAGRILPALRARGYEFTVVTLKENADLPEEDEFQGIRVCRWPFWAALNSGNITQFIDIRQRVAALKRDFAPDLIHINFLGPTVLFHKLTDSIHPAPLLVSTDSAFLEQATGENSLAGGLFSSADWVTSVSREKLETIRKTIPEVASRSSCISYGVKVPEIERRPLPVDGPRLLCLGRLERQKGFDLALEAFASISPQFPQARLWIAGDGSVRADLERQIDELGLHDVVDMLGTIEPDDVSELMNRATLVLMPSRDEGLPNVALEAGMTHRPVIAARVAGLPEIIVDRETGLLIDPEDSTALAKAIRSLLNNVEEAERMGRQARLRMEDVFSFEKYVDSYDTLYRRLTADR